MWYVPVIMKTRVEHYYYYMLFGIEDSHGVPLSQRFTIPNRMHTENLLMFPRHIPSETILEKLLHAATTLNKMVE